MAVLSLVIISTANPLVPIGRLGSISQSPVLGFDDCLINGLVQTPRNLEVKYDEQDPGGSRHRLWSSEQNCGAASSKCKAEYLRSAGHQKGPYRTMGAGQARVTLVRSLRQPHTERKAS